MSFKTFPLFLFAILYPFQIVNEFSISSSHFRISLYSLLFLSPDPVQVKFESIFVNPPCSPWVRWWSSVDVSSTSNGNCLLCIKSNSPLFVYTDSMQLYVTVLYPFLCYWDCFRIPFSHSSSGCPDIPPFMPTSCSLLSSQLHQHKLPTALRKANSISADFLFHHCHDHELYINKIPLQESTSY